MIDRGFPSLASMAQSTKRHSQFAWTPSPRSDPTPNSDMLLNLTRYRSTDPLVSMGVADEDASVAVLIPVLNEVFTGDLVLDRDWSIDLTTRCLVLDDGVSRDQ